MSTEPTKEAAFFSTIRSWGIVRSDQRVAGGVLSGVGARVGMAPAPARIIFAVLALVTFGLAALLYAAAWALLPDAEGHIIIQDFGRGRPNVGALVAIAILAIVGLSTVGRFGLFDAFGWSHSDYGWFRYGPSGDIDGVTNGFGHVFLLLAAVVIPLAIIGGVVWLIVWAVRSSKSPDRAAQGYARMPDGTLPDAPVSPSVVAEEGTDESQAMEPAPSPETAVSADAVPASVAMYATAPERSPAPRVYSAPPTPPRPRVPGPGKMGYLMALAWIPITAAITLYLETSDQLAVYPVIAGGVIYVAGLGVILIITALRGRKLGFLGFVSAMSLIPVALSIGFATDLREQYADGSYWRGWVHDQGFGNQDIEPSGQPDPSFGPDPESAFDPTAEFSDYATVAINGSCWETDGDSVNRDANGTIRLSSIPVAQTITVTSSATRLVVPKGTSLNVITGDSGDFFTVADVTWIDRDTTCEVTTGGSPSIQLTNPDDPILTVRLDDAQQMGQMSLYIEEN